MQWIDIGVNLTDKAFAEDREAVLQRGWQAGISHMLLTCTSLDQARDIFQLCQTDPQRLFATAGVHPHSARDWQADSPTQLRQLARDPAVRALGECGLDFNRDFSPRPKQIKALEDQLELAVELGLPVFLHEREAGETLTAILKDYRDRLPAAVVHCFTAGREALYGYLDLDLHIGITGWICDERRGQHLHPLVSDIPRGRLMIETDAPWLLPRSLSPKPKKRRNEPAFITEVGRVLAECRNESIEDLAAHTSATAHNFFRLPIVS